MMKRTSIFVALCGWLMASGSLLAHHSLAATYDVKKEMELSGEVQSIKFSNPHGSLTIVGQECGRYKHRVGDDARLRHRTGAKGDRQNRTECPSSRG